MNFKLLGLLICVLPVINCKNFEAPTNTRWIRMFSGSITSVTLKPGGDYSDLYAIYTNDEKLENEAAYNLIRDVQNTSIQIVSFQRNKLSDVFDLGILKYTKSLDEIVLSYNNISEIINTSTDENKSLRKIMLTANSLVYLDLRILNIFLILKYLNLNENRLLRISNYREANSFLRFIQEMPIEKNNFLCSHLERMLQPYEKYYNFWYQAPESKCTVPKEGLYKGICCYETEDDQRSSTSLADLKLFTKLVTKAQSTTTPRPFEFGIFKITLDTNILDN